jgi:DNA end-binding protein Ku
MFAKALEACGSFGVAKVALKEQKEHLCVVRPFEGMLMLQTLHWADELRDYREIAVSANVSERELALAKQLITAMTKDIKLSDYTDEYRKAVLELVAAKIEGKAPPTVVAAPKVVPDMVDALLASLNAVGAGTN